MTLVFQRAAMLIAGCLALLNAGCGGPPGGGSQSSLQFSDVTVMAGLEYSGPSYVAGVADMDRDGWPDIAVSRHRLLYLHRNHQAVFDSAEIADGDVHGVTWMDWNGDGWPDLYVSRGANRGRGPGLGNALFENRDGELQAVDLGGPGLNLGGRGRSSTPWDVNGDGQLELFLLNYQTEQRLLAGEDRARDDGNASGWRDIQAETLTIAALEQGSQDSYLIAGNGGGEVYRFDSEGRLANITSELGISMPRRSAVSALVPFDADNDGDLDLYFVLAGKVNQGVRQVGNRLYFKFTSERELSAGIKVRTGQKFSMTLLAEGNRRHEWGRFADGGTMKRYPLELEIDDRRLLPAAGEPDLESTGLTLWRDNEDMLRLDFRADREQLQAATGWIESDATETVLVESYGLSDRSVEKANLFLVNNYGRFIDRTEQSGLGDAGAGQDAVSADFDNDGDLDLYVVNGRDIFGNPPNVLFENLGEGQFRRAPAGGILDGSKLGRGSSVNALDYDRDGDIDLLLTNGSGPAPGNEGPVQLLRNDSNGGNWLQVKLEASHSNTMALGAWLTLETANQVQSRQVMAATGRASVSWQPVHFGLGQADRATLTVDWPSGARSVQAVEANQYVTIREVVE